MSPFIIITLVAALGIGVVVGRQISSKGGTISKQQQQKIDEKERELRELDARLIEVKSDTKAAEAEARAQAKEIISDARLQAQEQEAKIEQEQARLEEREKWLDGKVKEFESARATLETRQSEVAELREELTEASAKHRVALEDVAKLSQEDAKDQLKTELEAEFSSYFADQIKAKRSEAEEDVEEKARDLLSQAMQRYAAEVASESTSTIVQLPSDDIKGKIIGKEGRNITAFENATGVDIIIDDTPEAIVISGYDLARRYVAKLSMEKLIEDGRIQPARIEETVEKMKQKVGKMMLEFGKRAVEELGIVGYPEDLLKIIGRLRFRTSYGQNILKHSIEMAQMGRTLAEEIGADPQIVIEGCLLHDVGKALDHEVAGTHVEIGVEICKRFKVRDEVTHCVAAHHEDIPLETPEAFIVAAVDAISGARPGARKESFDAYVKRLKELEDTAKDFDGVARAFAISAGREVRVYVDTQKVNDLEQEKLARAITEKIEKELTYPGVIKVNVIRERRIEGTAK